MFEGSSVGGGPGHEHCERHDRARGPRTGGHCQQPVPRQDLQPASAGLLQRRGRSHVLSHLRLPDGLVNFTFESVWSKFTLNQTFLVEIVIE